MGAGRTARTDTEVAPAGAAFFAWRGWAILGAGLLAVLLPVMGLLEYFVWQTPHAFHLGLGLSLWAGLLVAGVWLSRASRAETLKRAVSVLVWGAGIWTIQVVIHWQITSEIQNLLQGDAFRASDSAIVFGSPSRVRLEATVTLSWIVAAVVSVFVTAKSCKTFRRNLLPVAGAFS